ncbi:hypothetical protein BDV25DRAFT_135520 [Aspergillus avenaceus]|uniref:Uncharacterized protein n=1 Tax=Aspergillus avenaceus TaxID=36643 RepID=A0A5N6U8D6_ASPAV|nr:hypothetical protein BDV25DRAFT_135520 [Aspergillus avenaceus]
MKIQLLAISLGALFAGSTLACETRSGTAKNCEWFGTAPTCGWTNRNIGDQVNEWTLVDWTKDKTKNTFCFAEDNGNAWGTCCDDYGSECIGGYKRLWCKG